MVRSDAFLVHTAMTEKLTVDVSGMRNGDRDGVREKTLGNYLCSLLGGLIIFFLIEQVKNIKVWLTALFGGGYG